MASAIAKQPIFPGAAVAQSADAASLAGPNLLASHIASTGAPQGGIVSLINRGNVFLDDWTLSTGAKRLKVGATYYVGPFGKLALSGSQPVGIATSINTLLVTIQNTQTAASAPTDTSSLQTQISNLQTQLNNLLRLPPQGSTNQVLTKRSPTSGDVSWQDPPSYASVAKYGF